MWDIVSFGKEELGVIGVQTTSGSNVSQRIRKLQGNPLLREWLACGNGAVVHGWRKAGGRGKCKTWQLREVHVSD